MALLCVGLLVFLGIHSTRMFAEPLRERAIKTIGEGPWKLVYSLVSIASFVLIVRGYAAARLDPTVLWAPPLWTRHLAALLTVPAIVLLVAAYVPGNHLKAAVKHPMLAGTKVWALAHLVANNTLADLVLFGSFLVWAVLCFRSARKRDRENGTTYNAGRLAPTLVTASIGVASWALIAFWAHGVLIGVRPFA